MEVTTEKPRAIFSTRETTFFCRKSEDCKRKKLNPALEHRFFCEDCKHLITWMGVGE